MGRESININTNMKIIIREAKKEDIGAIRDLIKYLMKVEEVEDIEENVRKIIEDRILPSLDSDTARTFVAEIDGKVAGMLLVELKRGLVLSLAYIAVYPKNQNQGVGRELLKKAEEYARSKDIHILEGLVHKDNQKSRDFHEKNGFKLFGYNLRKEI